jgi:hypothetical protein
MATHQSSPTPDATYHTCTCGAEFESTDALLDHARESHGLDVR